MILPEYQCPVCKKTYSDFESAMNCINGHPTLAKVDTPSERVVNAFEYVDVTMSDGTVHRYKYHTIIGGDDWDD